MPTRDPRSFLPLTPLAFQVLLSLADASRHGYGIILDVDERTDGLIKLKTGTLYVLLQRLVEEDLIEASDGPRASGDDERRKYYGLTTLGRAVIRAEAERLAVLVGEARRKRVLGKATRA